MITLKELKREMEIIAEDTKKEYTRKGGVPLTFYVLCEDEKGKKGMMICPLMGQDIINHKREIAYHLGKIIRQAIRQGRTPDIKRVNAIIASSESWLVKLKPPEGQSKEEFEKRAMEIRPSQHPDREEALIIAGMTEQKEASLIIYKISERDGKKRLTRNREMEKGMKLESYLLDGFWEGLLMQFAAD